MTEAQEIYERQLEQLKEHIKVWGYTEPEDILKIAFDAGIDTGEEMFMSKTLKDIYDAGYENALSLFE